MLRRSTPESLLNTYISNLIRPEDIFWLNKDAIEEYLENSCYNFRKKAVKHLEELVGDESSKSDSWLHGHWQAVPQVSQKEAYFFFSITGSFETFDPEEHTDNPKLRFTDGLDEMKKGVYDFSSILNKWSADKVYFIELDWLALPFPLEFDSEQFKPLLPEQIRPCYETHEVYPSAWDIGLKKIRSRIRKKWEEEEAKFSKSEELLIKGGEEGAKQYKNLMLTKKTLIRAIIDLQLIKFCESQELDKKDVYILMSKKDFQPYRHIFDRYNYELINPYSESSVSTQETYRRGAAFSEECLNLVKKKLDKKFIKAKQATLV